MSGTNVKSGGSDGKEPACNEETRFQSLRQKDPLEKGMATHYSIPPWRISWTEESGKLQSMGSQRVRHNRVTNHFQFKKKGGGAENCTEFLFQLCIKYILEKNLEENTLNY